MSTAVLRNISASLCVEKISFHVYGCNYWSICGECAITGQNVFLWPGTHLPHREFISTFHSDSWNLSCLLDVCTEAAAILAWSSRSEPVSTPAISRSDDAGTDSTASSILWTIILATAVRFVFKIVSYSVPTTLFISPVHLSDPPFWSVTDSGIFICWTKCQYYYWKWTLRPLYHF